MQQIDLVYIKLQAVHKLCRLGSPKDDLLNRPYIIKKTRGVKTFWF